MQHQIVKALAALLREDTEAICYADGRKVGTEGHERARVHLMQRLAEIAFHVNSEQENIGARRLHTVMERLLETISFEAADRNGEQITVDLDYVNRHLGELVKNQDLSRYIL